MPNFLSVVFQSVGDYARTMTDAVFQTYKQLGSRGGKKRRPNSGTGSKPKPKSKKQNKGKRDSRGRFIARGAATPRRR